MTEQAIQAVGMRNKFKGMSFVFAGKLSWGVQDNLAVLIQLCGGEVFDDVTADTTYLVVGISRGVPAAQKAAEKFNKAGSAIQIIDQAKALNLVSFSKDELVQAFKSPAASELLRPYSALSYHKQSLEDISGSNLRGTTLTSAQLHAIVVDGVDFSDSTLSGVGFVRANQNSLQGVVFDRSSMTNCHIGSMKGCSLKDAKIFQLMGGYGTNLDGCDFERASLTHIGATQGSFNNCNFKSAQIQNSWFNSTAFANCDLSKATMKEVQFQGCLFKNCNLQNVDLSQANLCEAKFEGTNLSNANLSGAVLVDADFTKATIDGADFSDATVMTAKFEASQIAKAKGLKEAMEKEKSCSSGPRLQDLEDALANAQSIAMSLNVTTPDGEESAIQVSGYSPKKYPHAFFNGTKMRLGSPNNVHLNGKSLQQVMAQIASKCKSATIDFESFSCKLTNSTLPPKEAKQLGLAAWCEALGLEVPDEKTLKEAKSQQKAAQTKHRDTLMAELRGGMSGIKSWNARSIADKLKAGNFRKADLTNQHLCDAQLDRLDFEGANFDGANLSYAILDNCELKKASFKNATLEKAQFGVAKAQEADFSGAMMKGAVLRACNFSKAIFHKTDLTGADLHYAKLHGADLSTANLTDANVQHAEFDEHTKMPPDFCSDGMKWCGAGPDPLAFKQVLADTPTESLNFEEFLERLQNSIDKERLKKALKMLKAESFQLFAEVTDDAMIGVVKSQTDADLVYSARLASNGVYACCTQNLNPCGGLRGALCKHLLVLVIGLTKAGQLDPNKADLWARASKNIQTAKLDKDIMSETFLRYKGAEAGEIDWRPTETIPEDYYAF